MNQSSTWLISSIVSLSAMATAWPQDADEEPRRCLSLTSIDRTEVIDDQNIAFYLRRNEIYINELDRPCNGLERKGRFSYRTSTGLLCSADSITVLEDSGFGLREGFSCGLGRFRPADEELVALLKGDEEPAEVTVEDIEVEDTEVEE